jgi:hypothetical protein
VRAAVVAGGQGHSLFDDVGDFAARSDQLEHAAVHFPVTELRGSDGVVAEIDDVQPVGQVIEDDATFTAEHSDRARLVKRLHLGTMDQLAPVPGGRLELQFLRRRAGREQHDIGIIGADSGLVWRPLEGGKESVSHRQVPSAGRNHTWPS